MASVYNGGNGGDPGDIPPWTDDEEADDNSEFSEFDEGDDDAFSEVNPSILDDISDTESEPEDHQGNYVRLMRKFRRRGEKLDLLAGGMRQALIEKRRLSAQNRELQERLAARNGRAPRQIEPWHAMLARGANYKAVYKASCQQGNMSRSRNIHHPDISFREELDLEPEPEPVASPWHDIDFSRLRPLFSLILPSIVTRVRPLSQSLLEPAPFPFERLPADIQVRVFKLLLVKDSLIHCLSRLDRYNRPVGSPRRFPNRFHVGTSPCVVTEADEPSDILKYLCVSKRWYYIGVHAFYGANTFAFSSLGEMGRFMEGIGLARLERIVNIELNWHGSLMQAHGTGVSQRSLPLTWLTKTKRLRTFVVHIDESSKQRIRRKYEIQDKNDVDKDFADEDEYPLEELTDPCGLLVKRTDVQPNYRNSRSMRTLQGLDFVYQLRGMRWVRFKESMSDEYRSSIRDWSFSQDVNNVVTQPQTAELAHKYMLDNLSSLTGLEDWDSSDSDISIIQAFYDEKPVAPGPHAAGSETSESDDQGFMALSSAADDSASSSSDDSDSGGGGSGSGDGDGDGDDDGDGDEGGLSVKGRSPMDESMDIDADNSTTSNGSTDGTPRQGNAHSSIPLHGSQHIIDLTEDGDYEDAESNLFVSAGSGSGDTTSAGGRPSLAIDLTGGQTYNTSPRSRAPHTHTSDDESSLFVEQERMVIDLTGDDDDEPSNSKSTNKKQPPPKKELSLKKEPSPDKEPSPKKEDTPPKTKSDTKQKRSRDNTYLDPNLPLAKRPRGGSGSPSESKSNVTDAVKNGSNGHPI